MKKEIYSNGKNKKKKRRSLPFFFPKPVISAHDIGAFTCFSSLKFLETFSFSIDMHYR